MRFPDPIGRPIVMLFAISILVAACGSDAAAPGRNGTPGPVPTATADPAAAVHAPAAPAAAPSGTARPAAPAASSTPPLRLVAIGDSLAQASSCRGCVDFVDRYGQALAQTLGRPVDVDNRAAIQLSALPPVQAAQLLNDILVDPTLRASIRTADVVVVNVGFNDTPWNRFDNPCGAANMAATIVDWAKIDAACIRRVTDEYAQRLDQILSQIDELRGCARPFDQPVDFCATIGRPVTAIRVVSVYDDWIGEPGVSRQAVDATSAADRAFLEAQCWVAELHGARCADVLHVLNGARALGDAKAYLVEDHTHLNQAGHDQVARVLAQLGFDPVR